MASGQTRIVGGIVPKKSSVSGKIPTGTTAGEIFSNLTDRKLWGYDGANIFEYGSSTFLGLTGGTVGGDIQISGGFSATTISGDTLNSGSTNLYSIFSQTDTITRVQPGSNITTGGTANAPTVNLTASPSVNNITFSGTAIGGTVQADSGNFSSLSATSMSATTYYGDGSNLTGIVSGGSFTGGTVTGNTIFTQGITASTISATTYYNIPTVFGSGANGAGGTVTTGITGYVVMGHAGRITGWDIIGATSGTVVMDIWKTTDSTLPTVAGSITGAAKPRITSGVYSGSTNLTNWSGLTYSTGDKFGFNIDSISGFTTVTLTLRGFKSN